MGCSTTERSVHPRFLCWLEVVVALLIFYLNFLYQFDKLNMMSLMGREGLSDDKQIVIKISGWERPFTAY